MRAAGSRAAAVYFRRWLGSGRGGSAKGSASLGFDYFDDEDDDAGEDEKKGAKDKRSGQSGSKPADLSDYEFSRLLDGFEERKALHTSFTRAVPRLTVGKGFQERSTRRSHDVPGRKPGSSTARHTNDVHAWIRQIGAQKDALQAVPTTEEITAQIKRPMRPEERLKVYFKALEGHVVPGPQLVEVALVSAEALWDADSIRQILQHIQRYGVQAPAAVFNSAFRCFAFEGDCFSAQALLGEMWQYGGIRTPTADSYLFALRACVVAKQHMTYVQVVSEMLERGVHPDEDVAMKMIRHAFRDGDLDFGWRLVEKLRSQTGVCLTEAHLLEVSGHLARMGQFRLLRGLFPLLVRTSAAKREQSPTMTIGLCTTVVAAAAASKEPHIVEFFAAKLRREYPALGPLEDIYCPLALTKAAAGDVEAALDVIFELDIGTSPTLLRSLRELVDLLVSSEKLRLRCQSYLLMCKERGQKVPIAAMNCIIAAHAISGNFDSAWSVLHDSPQKYGAPLSTDSFNAILQGALVHDRLDEARRVPAEMLVAGLGGDRTTCELMIRILARNGRAENLADILQWAKENGVEPSRMSFRIAARCCYELSAGLDLSRVVQSAQQSGFEFSDLLPELGGRDPDAEKDVSEPGEPSADLVETVPQQVPQERLSTHRSSAPLIDRKRQGGR